MLSKLLSTTNIFVGPSLLSHHKLYIKDGRGKCELI